MRNFIVSIRFGNVGIVLLQLCKLSVDRGEGFLHVLEVLLEFTDAALCARDRFIVVSFAHAWAVRRWMAFLVAPVALLVLPILLVERFGLVLLFTVASTFTTSLGKRGSLRLSRPGDDSLTVLIEEM